MNACCGSRSSRPAGLFSFVLLDGLKVRLRRPHLREAHGMGRVLVRLGGGWNGGFGLSCLATTFMNNPG